MCSVNMGQREREKEREQPGHMAFWHMDDGKYAKNCPFFKKLIDYSVTNSFGITYSYRESHIEK